MLSSISGFGRTFKYSFGLNPALHAARFVEPMVLADFSASNVPGVDIDGQTQYRQSSGALVAVQPFSSHSHFSRTLQAVVPHHTLFSYPAPKPFV
jgi:hypothetical protein